MKQARTRFLLVTTTCLLACAFGLAAGELPRAEPESVGMSSQRLARIGPVIEGYIERGEIPGALTLVARRGKIVHFEAHGFADLATRRPMKHDDVFRMASMTKPIASVALMMLYEEGFFRLNDPISEFLPEFKNPKVAIPVEAPVEASANSDSGPGFYTVPAKREITFRHLLTHTAGLATQFSSDPTKELYIERVGSVRTSGGTLARGMRELAKLPLNFHPGEKWQYGPATDVVGYLVEVISGMPFDRFLRDRVFKPLGMSDTYFYVPEDKLARRATVYSTEGGKLSVRDDLMTTTIPPRENRYFSGAGGLLSTAQDYLRFCLMSLGGGRFGDARLLSPKTVELMTVDHVGDDVPRDPIWDRIGLDGFGFGLGYRVRKDLGRSAVLGSLGSYGWGGAYGTYFWIDPKEDMIGILMVQIRPYAHLKIRRQFQILANAAIVE